MLFSVTVTDWFSGLAVPNAGVYAQPMTLGWLLPEEMPYKGKTDRDGICVLDLPTVEPYNFGIVAYGYTAWYSGYAPRPGWERIYSIMGAATVREGGRYDLEVMKSDVSPQLPPEEQKPEIFIAAPIAVATILLFFSLAS